MNEEAMAHWELLRLKKKKMMPVTVLSFCQAVLVTLY